MTLPLFMHASRLVFYILNFLLMPRIIKAKTQMVMVADYGRNACRTRQGFTEMPTSFSDPLNILRSSDIVARK